MIATAAAPTSGVSCDLAPAASAIGVLDALLEIGNPWKNPVAAFATPRATSSRSASTSSLRFVASDCDSTLVSAIATSATAKAATISSGTTSTGTVGTANPGSPRGSTPTVSTERSSSATAAMPPTTTTNVAGTRGANRPSRTNATREDAPIASVVGSTAPSPIASAIARTWSSRSSASIENPSIFGSWPTTIVRAMPAR